MWCYVGFCSDAYAYPVLGIHRNFYYLVHRNILCWKNVMLRQVSYFDVQGYWPELFLVMHTRFEFTGLCSRWQIPLQRCVNSWKHAALKVREAWRKLYRNLAQSGRLICHKSSCEAHQKPKICCMISDYTMEWMDSIGTKHENMSHVQIVLTYALTRHSCWDQIL